MTHEPGADDADDADGFISNEEWAWWLQAELRQCPAYAEHGPLLEECCTVATMWRQRFWEDKALWGRIRKGKRLAKELAEAAPVIQKVREQVAALELAADQPRMVVIDMCSGFGYLSMFLSELLPKDKVARIVLVDLQWPRPDVPAHANQINADHINDPRWPIRLTTSRANLKVPSDRRGLAKAFLSHGAPSVLLGVHLCGTLSLRAIDLFNDCPGFCFLVNRPESNCAIPTTAGAAPREPHRGIRTAGSTPRDRQHEIPTWAHHVHLHRKLPLSPGAQAMLPPRHPLRQTGGRVRINDHPCLPSSLCHHRREVEAGQDGRCGEGGARDEV